MASSKRRLEYSPDRRRTTVTHVEPLIAAFLTHHDAMGHSPKTIKHYGDSLRLFLRCLEENEIPATTAALNNATMTIFAGWLRTTPTREWRGKTERSTYGVRGALVDLKVFTRWLAEGEYIDRAPKITMPKLPQGLFPVLTDQELKIIFASKHLDAKTEQSIRNRALIAFMLDTGVRLSEAANLTMHHIFVSEGTAKIHGKGNKERLVYFSDAAREAIQKWLKVRGTDDGQVFWLETSGIRMLLRRIKEDTGLPLLHAHQLRHTCFTQLVKQNVDLHTIKRLAGHASVTTTEAYLALADDDLKDKHTAASPFDALQRRTAPPKARRRLRAGS